MRIAQPTRRYIQRSWERETPRRQSMQTAQLSRFASIRPKT
jgi:hypothetical protein